MAAVPTRSSRCGGTPAGCCRGGPQHLRRNATWLVHEQLRSCHAIILIDGVDELADDRREKARTWLRDLVADFPRARYVVTFRPAAAPPT